MAFATGGMIATSRSEEHTSELQSLPKRRSSDLHRGYVYFKVREEPQQADLQNGERQNCNGLCHRWNDRHFAAKVRLCLVHRFSPSCSLANASMSEPSNMG